MISRSYSRTRNFRDCFGLVFLNTDDSGNLTSINSNLACFPMSMEVMRNDNQLAAEPKMHRT